MLKTKYAYNRGICRFSCSLNWCLEPTVVATDYGRFYSKHTTRACMYVHYAVAGLRGMPSVAAINGALSLVTISSVGASVSECPNRGYNFKNDTYML